MPRKEKPADPLLQVAMPSSGDVIPALVGPSSGHNSLDPIIELGRAGKLLDVIDAKIFALNQQKKAVYAELTERGFKKAAIKYALASRKIDPILAAEQKRVNDLYTRAVAEGIAKVEAEEAEAAKIDEAAE